MAEADRIAAALRYIDEQKPADPFASLKSDPIGALRSAWERKVDPIINNAKRTFATGGVLGDILRAYGEAGAPANRAVLKGMGMPYKDPAVVNTPPTLAPDNSYGNMGDATAQTFGTIIGDPLNFVQPGAARIANALKFAKPDALKMLNEMSQGARSPMDVWHGSPHRFPPTAKNPLGEFDASKIGTGEGAQAYGHGHYLAEARGVGSGYQKDLGGGWRTAFNDEWSGNLPQPAPLAGSMISKHNGNIEAAVADLRSSSEPAYRQAGDWLEKQHAAGAVQTKELGSLYKVDLPDAQILKMLDFNNPLKNQSPEIQKAMQDLVKTDVLGRPTGISVDPNMNGQWAYERLAGIRGAKYAAEAMREAGIPGIRYLDGGSRAGGKGTSNFVVFPGSEGQLNILGRE